MSVVSAEAAEVEGPRLTERGRFAARAALLAAVYAGAAWLGLQIHAVNGFASLVWPATGIALAALLSGGSRYWPAIAAGAFAANLLAGAPLAAAAGIAVGNTLEAIFGAWALSRIPGFDSSLRRVTDVVGFIVLAGVFGTMISATVGTTSLLLTGTLRAAGFSITWRDWWLGDLVGALVVAPLLLTLRSGPRRRDAKTLLETAALVLSVVGASLFLFYESSDLSVSLLSPLLVWAALRFERRGAARATFVISAIAVMATMQGLGPFARAGVEEDLFALQSFMALTAGTFLVLGAAVAERRRSEEDRRAAEREVHASEERYRSLTDAVDLLIWINDVEGRTVFVNRRWSERLGVDLSEANGQDWTHVVHPDDMPAVLATRVRGLAAGEPYQVEFRCRLKDGSYRWMLARVVPVREGPGPARSWFGSAADIHDLKTAEEELRRAKEQAEGANRAKDQFLAALSHELRTPLTPVLAASSSLEADPEISATARRRIAIVRRNAELEARLIDDLLDLTRIARGKLQIELEPVAAADVVRHVLEICRPDAVAKGVALEPAAVDPAATVLADPARLRQIVWNIVKNAIQFTPAGGKVTVGAARADRKVIVEISDTGAGIDPSDLARIFQPFEQAGSRPGGLGLGLAIANALVEAHHGRLTATSPGLGRGSVFRLELAAADESARVREPRRAPEGGGAGRPRRILLVEDHSDTLELARELLGELSCEVVTARSVAEGLAAAENTPLDLVVSDIGLPDGTGLELMRALRERHGLLGIAVTGYGMEEDLHATRAAGFVDHLVKPITIQRLAAAVERFFDAHPAAAADASPRDGVEPR